MAKEQVNYDNFVAKIAQKNPEYSKNALKKLFELPKINAWVNIDKIGKIPLKRNCTWFKINKFAKTIKLAECMKEKKKAKRGLK